MTTLIINIKQLAGIRETNTLLWGKDLSVLPVIDDAFLLIDEDIITDYGPMYELSLKVPEMRGLVIDAEGQTILPAWCDSHTHLVFAKSREEEFVSKLKGKTYAEIAAGGGGILNSAAVLNKASESELTELALERLEIISKMGTGAVEIKSGYGLTVEGELKMLRVIKKLKQRSPLLIKSTFLAAHAYPEQYKNDHEGYINKIIDEMLPVIAEEKLAEFIDVFCEEGFFSVDEMKKICEAGATAGLIPKLHINQLNSLGGVKAAVELKALSADHLETMTREDIKLLSDSSTIGTLLPTAAFFLRMNYQPARELIDAGCAIALASDYNPGSSPAGNMNFVNALSCIQMKMLPEEVVNASTINGAYAMGIQDIAGSITVGKKANLIFTKKIPSVIFMPYSFSHDLIDKVMISGHFI